MVRSVNNKKFSIIYLCFFNFIDFALNRVFFTFQHDLFVTRRPFPADNYKFTKQDIAVPVGRESILICLNDDVLEIFTAPPDRWKFESSHRRMM
ncbi:hypothetical protein DJ81_16860 [Halorubrum sp. Hd13]|nr:hypothetical protein DJ81_16860 [Halorubrum sp. Hd13]